MGVKRSYEYDIDVRPTKKMKTNHYVVMVYTFQF
jgi:hypothetical protein